MPVAVYVYNAAMQHLMANGKEIPDDRAQRRLLFDLTGAWGVGIVPASAALSALGDVPYGGYGGHLILCVGEFTVDTTIQQTQRPDKGILLPPMLSTQFAAELMSAGRLILEVGDCKVIYDRIADESYRDAPDWKRRSTPYPETVRKIIARVEAG